MSRRFALAAALAASLLVPGVATATTSTVSVSAGNRAFTSGSPTIGFGDSVQWQTFATTVAHTTTSDKFGGTAFGWDISLPQGSGTYGPVGFDHAGGFAYHCKIHPGMRGTVMVQLMVQSGSHVVGVPFAITFASTNAPAGFSEQIQKRPAGGTWKTISTGNTGTSTTFKPKKAKTFQFRARLVQGGVMSNWSPTLSVAVTAH